MPPVMSSPSCSGLLESFGRVFLKFRFVAASGFGLSPVGNVVALAGKNVQCLNVFAFETDVRIPRSRAVYGVNACHKRRIDSSPNILWQRRVLRFLNQIGVRLVIQFLDQFRVKPRAMFGRPGFPCRNDAGLLRFCSREVVIRGPEADDIIPIQKIRLLGRERVGRNNQAQEQ